LSALVGQIKVIFLYVKYNKRILKTKYVILGMSKDQQACETTIKYHALTCENVDIFMYHKILCEVALTFPRAVRVSELRKLSIGHLNYLP
jgi:hypothetical protein